MRKRNRTAVLAAAAGLLLIAVLTILAAVYYTICGCIEIKPAPLTAAATLENSDGNLGEPFGIAVNGSDVLVSDGLNGKIWRVGVGREPVEFARGLSTPSAIAFDGDGNLIVADTGSHTIRRIDKSGAVSIVAGTEGQPGDINGPAGSARFNAPIGVAILSGGAIAVADTYNDKIKLIRDGSVTTIAGSSRGFADGNGAAAMFDTPCAVAAWRDGSILVADTMNSRIRIIGADGNVSTVAGTGDAEVRDGTLLQSAFYRPFAIAAGPDGSLFIADNNAVRMIKNRPLPVVETVTDERRGFADGPLPAARFNRVSGIAVTDGYEVYLADSDNAAVRRIFAAPAPAGKTPEYVARTKRTDPEEFRNRQPPRWPYDPPMARRDVAGTLGEIRGHLVDEKSRIWFHNGLDIAGGYGEVARFIRDETALNPVSAENFNTSRELIRLPTVGYIHIRLGRDPSDRPLGDARFQFDPGMTDVRVRRGTMFKAGEVIGTLNALNHVHMIAGPSGDEMNALDALVLPGVADTIAPVIEKTTFFDQNWAPLETKGPEARITLAGNTRIVVRAFDRMDGNPERRRLGVYRLAYQVLNSDRSPLTETNWNINFDRNPAPEAVRFAYAPGSRSGATGETIFRYIVTNKVSGESFSEGFFNAADMAAGVYILRVFAADHFGNTTSKDITFEVAK